MKRGEQDKKLDQLSKGEAGGSRLGPIAPDLVRTLAPCHQRSLLRGCCWAGGGERPGVHFLQMGVEGAPLGWHALLPAPRPSPPASPALATYIDPDRPPVSPVCC